MRPGRIWDTIARSFFPQLLKTIFHRVGHYCDLLLIVLGSVVIDMYKGFWNDETNACPVVSGA